jgi:hypothetical protein
MWHTAHFYTAGELVAEQIPGCVPYADKNGLWVRAWPNPDRAFIEQDWKPHLNGSLEPQQALSKPVHDLASASSHNENPRVQDRKVWIVGKLGVRAERRVVQEG